MKRVLLREPVHASGVDLLRARADVDLMEFQFEDVDAFNAALPGAHGVLVRTATLDEAQLSAAPDLMVVSRHGVGCDSIAVDHMTARGLPVAIATGANAVSVAEQTLMMLLSGAKAGGHLDRAVRDDNWAERVAGHTFEVSGKTCLVVGHGHVGRKVARLCEAFGMTVIVNDPLIGTDALEGRESVDLASGLARADFVTLHCPLDSSTAGLIDATAIHAMRPGVILINCARGGIVDEVALADALRDRRVAFAGLDVFSVEPAGPENPLLSLPNVILSPHAAAATREAIEKVAEIAARNILDCFDGRLAPENIFNRRELGL